MPWMNRWKTNASTRLGSASETSPTSRRSVRLGKRFRSHQVVRIIIGQDAPPDAAWRAENIQLDGFPVTQSLSMWPFDEEESADSILGDDSPTRQSTKQDVDNTGDEGVILKGGPSGDETSATDSSVDSTDVEEFRNYGLERWEKARAAWRVNSVTENRPAPPQVKRDAVAKGLTQISRTYDLPDRVSLRSLVGICVSVWDGEKD